MLTFNDVLQLYSGFDYDKLLSIAKKSAEKFLPACRKVEKCPYGDLIFTFILFSVFKVDFYLYDNESKFITDIADLIGAELVHLPPEVTENDFRKGIGRFVKTLPSETGTEVLLFCICAASVCGSISPLKRILLMDIFDSIKKKS